MIEGHTKSRAARRLALVFWSLPAAMSLLFLTRVWDRDLWWHLATGRFILDHRFVPSSDPFSYTAQGAPWTYVTLGADLVLYLTEHLLGASGLGVLKVLVALVMLYALAIACRLAGATRSASAAALIAATVLIQWRYTLLRPATMGAALLVASCALLIAWWRQPQRRWLVVNAVLVAIWTTVHATVVLAPVILLCALLAAASHAERRRYHRELIMAWLATAALLLLLPAGRGALASTYAHLRYPDVTAFISEWAPGDPSSPRWWLPILGALLGLALRPRLILDSPFPVALFGLGIALTLRGVRNQYEAILLSVPLLALALDAIASRLFKGGVRLAARSVHVVWPLGTVTALLLLESGPMFATWWGLGVRTESTPEDCVEVMKKLPPGRVLNDLDTGGYLIWRKVPVFADGRALVVYTRQLFERWFIPAFGSPQGMLVAANAFGVSYGLALQRKSLGQMMMASPDWIPVYHGRECSLFVRPAAALGVIRSGRPLLEEVRGVYEPNWMRKFYESVLSSPRGRERLEVRLRLVRRESPLTPILPIVDDTLETLRLEHFGQTHESNAGAPQPEPTVP